MTGTQTRRRASGVLLHPTSLPGPFGSGDLGPDAYRFVDWLEKSGQSLWQVLPLGEVGPGNSPYMSCSAFAGNVQLIDLHELHVCGWLTEAELKTGFTAETSHHIDFAHTVPFREDRLRRAARNFFMSGSHEQRAEFSHFCTSEQEWLNDYALFKSLAQGGKDWSSWSPALAWRETAALAQASIEHQTEIEFWKFCQWCFFRQWMRLKHYANEHGVRLIGDMPIFVAYQSAEVWANPDLFELDSEGRAATVAGVPPDYFSETGQRWGNPLYRWDAHKASGYAWWIKRVSHTLRMADLIRIDHFRGFAAYWAIPSSDPTAVNGKWITGPGADIFQALRDGLGELPIIAEDLGVITDDVVALRDQFALPGMRILQFAFGETAEHPFLPHNYPTNTVAYCGTHDNDTLLGWWASTSVRQRALAQHYLGSDGQSIHWDMMRCLSASVADTVVHSMQDILGLGSEHRMNFPGLPDENWRWRFSWDQLQSWHGQTLGHFAAAHGRTDLSLAELPA